MNLIVMEQNLLPCLRMISIFVWKYMQIYLRKLIKCLRLASAGRNHSEMQSDIFSEILVLLSKLSPLPLLPGIAPFPTPVISAVRYLYSLLDIHVLILGA